MEEILKIFQSINFWTIVSSIATVIGVYITAVQVLKERKNKKRESQNNTLKELANEYENISYNLLFDMNRLSEKVKNGTQNDKDGVQIQESINELAFKLRKKGLILFNTIENSYLKTKEKEILKNEGEAIYNHIASILNNRNGSLTELENLIKKFNKSINEIL